MCSQEVRFDLERIEENRKTPEVVTHAEFDEQGVAGKHGLPIIVQIRYHSIERAAERRLLSAEMTEEKIEDLILHSSYKCPAPGVNCFKLLSPSPYNFIFVIQEVKLRHSVVWKVVTLYPRHYQEITR